MPAEIYKNAAGKRLPGVTTICGNLGWGTQGLKYWANELGLQGLRLSEATSAADTGKLAHAMIEAHIKGETLDVSKVPPAMVETCESILKRFRRWYDREVDEALISEEPMVSEEHQYGGRLDLVFRRKDTGTIMLLDVKTGGTYPDHLVQLAGYAGLVHENTEHRIEEIALLRIPQSFDGLAPAEFAWEGTKVQRFAVGAFERALWLHGAHKVLRKAV